MRQTIPNNGNRTRRIPGTIWRRRSGKKRPGENLIKDEFTKENALFGAYGSPTTTIFTKEDSSVYKDKDVGHYRYIDAVKFREKERFERSVKRDKKKKASELNGFNAELLGVFFFFKQKNI